MTIIDECVSLEQLVKETLLSLPRCRFVAISSSLQQYLAMRKLLDAKLEEDADKPYVVTGKFTTCD